jgi:hypothetical protein
MEAAAMIIEELLANVDAAVALAEIVDAVANVDPANAAGMKVDEPVENALDNADGSMESAGRAPDLIDATVQTGVDTDGSVDNADGSMTNVEELPELVDAEVQAVVDIDGSFHGVDPTAVRVGPADAIDDRSESQAGLEADEFAVSRGQEALSPEDALVSDVPTRRQRSGASSRTFSPRLDASEEEDASPSVVRVPSALSNCELVTMEVADIVGGSGVGRTLLENDSANEVCDSASPGIGASGIDDEERLGSPLDTDESMPFEPPGARNSGRPLPTHAPRPPSSSGSRSPRVFSRIAPPPISYEKLRELALLIRPIPGRSMGEYDALIEDFHAQLVLHRNEHQYEEGRKLNDVLAHVKNEKENQRKVDLQREAIEANEMDRSIILEKLDDFDAETKRQLHELEEQLMEERKKLQEEQKHEFDRHDGRWTSVPKERQYRSASVKLLENRRQLDLLLEKSEFAEAEEVAAVIQQREAAEEEGMANLRQHDYDETVKLLTARHESELEGFDERAAVVIAQLLQRRDRERLAFANRQQKVKKREQVAKNKERIWALEQTRLATNLSRDVRLERGSSKSSIRPSAVVSRIEQEAHVSVPRATSILLPPLVKAKRPKTVYPAT